MKEGPIQDKLFGRVVVRADGRATHDMYLFRAKKPEESEGSLGLLHARQYDSSRPGFPAA